MCIHTPAGWQYLAGTQFIWSMNPQSASSFVNVSTVRLAAEYFPMVRRPHSWSEYNRGAYYGGTDDDLGESMIGIPTTSVNSGHGIPAHHTSFDTPAQVDPKSLRDLAVMNAAYTYFLHRRERSRCTGSLNWLWSADTIRSIPGWQTAWTWWLRQRTPTAWAICRLEKARVDYNLARETKAVKKAADLQQELPRLPPLPLRRKSESKAPSRGVQRNCIWERSSRWPPTSARSRKDYRSPQANRRSPTG